MPGVTTLFDAIPIGDESFAGSGDASKRSAVTHVLHAGFDLAPVTRFLSRTLTAAAHAAFFLTLVVMRSDQGRL